MSRSSKVRREQAGVEALVESLMGIIEAGGRGVVHLDAHGRTVEMNEAAERILKDSDILSNKNGCLSARARQDNREIQHTIGRALPPPGTQAIADAVAVYRPDGRPRLALRVFPVNSSEKGAQSQSAAALVVIDDHLRDAGIDPSLIQKALRLTRAEAKVSVLLAQGKDARAIAESTYRAEYTIRTHIKRILAKLGLTRQAELVNLVKSLGVIP